MVNSTKRGPGRPRKAVLDSWVEPSNKLMTKSTKRGPGRPKKTSVQCKGVELSKNLNDGNGTIKSTKRGPGRPKKTIVQHTGFESNNNQDDGNGLMITSPKRGPGRPKKTIAQHGVELSNNKEIGSGLMIKSTKKGPGRPKRSIVQQSVAELSNDQDNENGLMINSTKRAFGHPKKTILQHSAVKLSNNQENEINFNQVKEEPIDYELSKFPVIQNSKLEFVKRESEPHLNEDHREEASTNDQTVPVQITPGSHLCPYCTVSFKDPTFLQQHVKYHHGDEYNDTVRRKSSRHPKKFKRESEPCLNEDYEEEAPMNDESVPEQMMADSHPCPYCTLCFTDPTFLQQHVKYHHPDEYIDGVRQLSSKLQFQKEQYSCSQCDCTFHTPGQLSLHKNKAHLTAPPKKKHTCPVCARSFDYLRNLRNHCRSWHDMAVYMHKGHLRCSNCRRSFKKSWGQGPHHCVGRKTKIIFAHPDFTKPVSLVVGVNCQVCGKTMRNPHTLKNHMLLHTNEKPYACRECGKAWRDAGSLRKHMFIHTGIKNFECEVCKKRFTEAAILRKHMIVHTGEKAFSCPECGKAFGLKQGLTNHRRKIHFPSEESFNCSECGKCFSSKKNVKLHMRIHFKTHQCGDCGLKVVSLAVLKIHMRKHTGERPYQCKDCGKNFKRKYHLVNHQRTHTGEKPFKCDQCESSFAQSGDLTIHKRRKHTGEKPYVCTICYRGFAVKGSLDLHSLIHSDERLYECDECGKALRWKTGLMRHKKQVHMCKTPHQCLYCGRRFKRPAHLKLHHGRCVKRKMSENLSE